MKSTVGLLARVDQFKPNTNSTTIPDGSNRLIIAGVFWEPSARTQLSVDYQGLTRENGLKVPESKTLFVHWQATF